MVFTYLCSVGNISGHAWLACLNPVQTLPRSLQPHVLIQLGSQTKQLQLICKCPLVCPLGRQARNSNQADSMQDSIIHAAGWLFSFACALSLQQMHHLSLAIMALHEQSWQCTLLSQIVNGFWVTAVAAVATDLFGYHSVHLAECDDQSTFNCGNFGIMLADACDQSVDIVKVSLFVCTDTCRTVRTCAQLPSPACLHVARLVVCIGSIMLASFALARTLIWQAHFALYIWIH